MTPKPLTLLCLTIFMIISTPVWSLPSNSPEKISLQLKWTHQFQFAGYYAAKEQGYYTDAGLDVEFIERTVDIDLVKQVLSGKAQYGVGDTGLISVFSKGTQIKALAAIFQHSPLVFISKKSSLITNPFEMKGKRIMLDKYEAQSPLRACFIGAGLKDDGFISVEHSYDNGSLVRDEIDVISAYSTNAPFYYQELGVDINIIKPQDYGVDFYGDILFTSTQETIDHPGRVKRFKQATIKGWHYALVHQEELIQLIHNKYNSKLSLNALRYEAKEIAKLISADTIPLGEINASRILRTAEVYAQLHIAKTLNINDIRSFLHQSDEDSHRITFTHQEQIWLSEHPHIKFTGDPDWLPYEAFTDKGEYIGIVADHLELIEKHSGIKFNIIPTKTWQESVAKVRDGKIDIISETVDSSLTDKLEFTKPYLSSPIVIVMNDKQSYVDNITQITDKKIALIKSYGYVEHITDAYPGLDYHWVDNMQQGLEAVSSGKVDVLLSTLAQTSYAIAKSAIQNIKIVGKTEFTNDLALGIKKEYASVLIPILNRAFDLLTESERKQIFDKWGKVEFAPQTDYRVAIQVSLGLLLLLSIVLYWNRTLRLQIIARKQAEVSLTLSEHRFSSLLEAVDSISVQGYDPDRKLIFWNKASEAIYGFTKQEALGKQLEDLIIPDNMRTGVIKAHQDWLQSGIAIPSGELQLLHKNGSLVDVFSSHVLQINVEGQQELFCIDIDLSDRKKAEEKLLLFSRVFNDTNEGITITNAQNEIVDVNPAFCDITGYSRDEVFGQNPRILSSGKHSPEFYAAMWQDINEQGHWQGEVWNRKKTGELYAELLTISTLLDDNDKVINYVGVFTDITHSKQQQEKLSLMAHYDILTGLPNRTLFVDRFHQSIAHSNRSEHQLAVCFLDLDNFKPVNDNHGHDAGDQLLIEVAQRITASIREVDTVSRQGGDEFTLLLNDIESYDQCELTLDRILNSLAQPYLIDGTLHHITASIGVTLYPDDNEDIDTLIRHADNAMYQAKQSGKYRYHIFDSMQDQQLTQKHHRLDEIQQALINNEFSLYYQPKVNMVTGKVFGVEALIRWLHPEKGLIPPLDFLPLIDGTDIELQVGDWVINQALQQMACWLTQDIKLEVSVNIASHHLQSDAFLVNLEAALAQYPSVNSQYLQLEILESSALGDLQAINGIIKTCQEALAVNIALDDFGTGYSSLTHLRNLSANTIKIDQSFVRDMLDDPDDYTIIDGVIGLTDAFNREVIAEGVETTEHGLMLLLMGCEQAQGYGIAKPMPADDLPGWLSAYTPNQEWLSCGNKVRTEKETKIRLFRLITEHWKNRFVSYIQSSSEDNQYEPIMSEQHDHCGRWINRAHKDNLFEQDSLKHLERAHNNFHFIAQAIHFNYQEGDIDKARGSLEGLITAYNEMSNVVGMCD